MSTIEERTRVPVAGVELDATLVGPDQRLPGVLFVHGWGGSQAQYLSRAREVAALGSVCLTFDLRGHARTRGQFETVSRAHNLADVLAAYDTLGACRQVDPASMAVVGSSYGGYLAAILSSLRPVKWLALRAPALYIDSGWDSPKLQLHRDQDLRTYRQRLVLAGENRALRAVQAFAGDLLLVRSERDHVIPREVLSSYHEAATSARSLTCHVLPGADHGLSSEADQRAYTRVLLDWLRERLAASARAPGCPPSGHAGGLLHPARADAPTTPS